MNQRPTIREQMDACRPDSDDLHLPEHAADLAELQASLRESAEVRTQWERSQQDGRVLRAVMQDVSLPAGLEGRLLVAVQAAHAGPLASVEQAVKAEAPSQEAASIPTPSNKSRRRFITVAATFATTAAAALIGFFTIQFYTQVDQPISNDQLVIQVDEWLRSVDESAMSPPAIANQSPPSKFVLGRVVRSNSFSSSQRKIVAYDLRVGSNHAILLEIPTTQVYPVSAVPFTSIQRVSGGWDVGAWQEGGILYVIAIRDPSDAHLGQFVPRQPVG